MQKAITECDMKYEGGKFHIIGINYLKRKFPFEW